MADEKALFAPVPLRAMSAGLSGLQFSALTCVASHDRLTLVKGKGQGCRASNERMSQMIGCNYARLCSTLSELVDLGFLRREKLGRRTVYRVIYNDFDKLLFSNVLAIAKRAVSARYQLPIGCRRLIENGGNLPESLSQYIPLNGEIESGKSCDEKQLKAARFPARRLARKESETAVAAYLATLERALQTQQPIDRVECLQWIGNRVFTADYSEGTRNWGLRLSNELINSMTAVEYASWSVLHGGTADV
jgi:hypothetical protein